ncbi:FAD-dependent oxidoreductase [Amorphus sp. 3PC139-8]|uniref:FAD-dependent oxidoreductase n=1 Tax=Amorphus sp. 3PC139-8 TaxID=2735676 RepID=UPI00345D2195
MESVDIVIVGAGTAGMPCAIEAVATGARVLVIEQADAPGGTLHVSLGQLSGAGSKLQAAHGIEDSAEAHLADIDRINRGTGRADVLRRTVPAQGDTIDWLMENGFAMDPACPAILHLHEAYRVARTYWGVEGGISVLKAVRPLFERAMAEPNAEIRYATRAVSLLTDGSGAVTGLRLADRETGSETEIAASSVVLATGGYGANAELFARLTGGRPLVTAAMETSTGTGLEMAEAVGARIVGEDLFLPTYAGVVSEPGGNRIVWRQMPSLTPQVRQPWELHLAPDGRRFVREDDPSVDAREHALENLPALSFWCVFDEAILAAAPPLLPGWTEKELALAWAGKRPDFVAADGIDDLAAKTGMAADNLREALADYAAACTGEMVDPMRRVHCPMPIRGPAFRAVKMHGIVLKTAAGLDIDDTMRVRRAEGGVIDGLYAVGEAIGGSTLSGKGFVSGMSVTPALTLGRWLGHTLGRTLASKETV